jgi:hypothetical protein
LHYLGPELLGLNLDPRVCFHRHLFFQLSLLRLCPSAAYRWGLRRGGSLMARKKALLTGWSADQVELFSLPKNNPIA